jgi:hypothetical protein
MIGKGSSWRSFPDPTKGGILVAPFGPGCYELRHRRSRKLILFGKGGHVASRMTSLLPKPMGTGVRKNRRKRKYIRTHLPDIEYRTFPCTTREDATECENRLRANRDRYEFKT